MNAVSLPSITWKPTTFLSSSELFIKPLEPLRFHLVGTFVITILSVAILAQCSRKRNTGSSAVDMDDDAEESTSEVFKKRKPAGFENRPKKQTLRDQLGALTSARDKYRNKVEPVKTLDSLRDSESAHHTPPSQSAQPTRSVLRSACPLHGFFDVHTHQWQVADETLQTWPDNGFWSMSAMEDTASTQCPSSDSQLCARQLSRSDELTYEGLDDLESTAEEPQCTCPPKDKKRVRFAK